MIFRESKIPYPNPYYDKDLMIKEIINGTFPQSLTNTLYSVQTIEEKYLTEKTAIEFVKELQKKPTDINTYLKDEFGLITISHIKQMSYLPYIVSDYCPCKEYVYYPPFYYSGFIFTGKDGVSIGNFELNDTGAELLEMPVYYYWHNNAGLFASTENEDGCIDGIYLITHDGRVIEILKDIICGEIVFQDACKYCFVFVQKTNDGYYLWIINLKKNNISIIKIDNPYNIFTLGDVSLIFKDDKLYDINGNEWDVEWRDGAKNLVPQGDDYFGSVQTKFGVGIFIDGVYYAPNTHNSSYRIRFNFKKKKAVVDIIKGDIGEMTSKIAFGYTKNYFKVIGDETIFDVYHYVYKKYMDFWVTKLPKKYKDIIGTKNQWYAYTEYGDFFIDVDNYDIYYTYGYNKWLKLPQPLTEQLLNLGFNVYRLWFARKYDNIVGVLGNLALKKDENNIYHLMAYGIIFLR